MPTYEYHCEKCNETFEIFQSMSAERLTTCPKEHCLCKDGWGQGKVKRLIGTGAGIIFKGSGFYCTDYRSNTYMASAKKDSSSATTSTTDSKSPKPAADTAKPTTTTPSSTP